MGTIRIINDKTGQVKFVSEVVANNTKTLEMYGFKVQHLEKKEEKEVFVKAVESNLQAFEAVVQRVEPIEEKNEIQVLNPTPKKGRKPNKI
jgi:hypothetical protein